MKVLRITTQDTLAIRYKMLRKNIAEAKEDCYFNNDEEDNTFHLGAFTANTLASVASFYLENNNQISETVQFRLRGMATLPKFQHQGLSSELLKMAFPIIKQNMCNILWCHARENAVGFYEKVGFKKTGDLFLVDKIGPHYLMILDLKDL